MLIEFIIEGIHCRLLHHHLECPDPKLYKRLRTIMDLPGFYEFQYFPSLDDRERFTAQKLVQLFQGHITSEKLSTFKPGQFDPDVKY